MVLRGLDSEMDAFVTRRFRRYLKEDVPASPALELKFLREEHGPYLPVDQGRDLQYRMEHAVRYGFLYYATASTCGRVDLGNGRGLVCVRERSGAILNSDPVHLAVENLLRACLAWVVLLRGGFMLHSASIVRDGKCYLFFGNSGAGKSTIASLCGGEVISDDLTMVLPSANGFEAIGSPFRGTYTACEDLTERYPVAGLYRLRKASQPHLEQPNKTAAFTDFLANLPFVVTEMDRHPKAWDLIGNAFGKVRIQILHFSKDASFWPLILGEGEKQNS
jgi:hypothetical protein